MVVHTCAAALLNPNGLGTTEAKWLNTKPDQTEVLTLQTEEPIWAPKCCLNTS